jgi:hypothetical protein
MSHRIRTIRLLRHWHARFGALAALFLVFLVLSGLALNHSDALGLASREVRVDWLNRWYGLKPAAPTQGYRLGEEYLAWDASRWGIGTKVIARSAPTPVGAVEVAGVRFIATANRVFVFFPDGTLVERLDPQALPGVPIQRLGRLGNEVAVQTGKRVFVSTDGRDWWPAAQGDPSWSSPEPLPSRACRAASELFEPTLRLERILQDLHSGRFFGPLGPLFVDLIAVVLFSLSLTGLWIYWRSVTRGPH